MSEAETPNNQPLPEPPASMDDSAADLPEASGISEESQIVTEGDLASSSGGFLQMPAPVKLSDLPNLSDFVEASRQEQTINSESTSTESSTAEADDDPAIEMSDVSVHRAKDADWFALTQKMRQRNRRLLDQVTQLKAALSEKEEALHLEQMRVRDRETVIIQQSEELRSSQEQLTRLFHTLESSHQAAQRQQILIETLSEQFQGSQERVAQLERECALLQQRYNEQSHQLLQAANTCRELRTRLLRQQRQTLQFKAALEKSLEMTTPSPASGQQSYPKSGNTPQTPFPRTQPIQPWSGEPEILEDMSVEPLWHRPIRLESLSGLYSISSEPVQLRRVDESAPPSTAEASIPIEDEKTPVSPTAASAQNSTDTEELELEQQLLAEMAALAEASGLSEPQSGLAEVQAQSTPEPIANPDEPDEAAPSISEVEASVSPEDSDDSNDNIQTLIEELWAEPADSEPTEPEPEPEEDVILPQPNWPSPVVYPLRPPKRLKSLASIELPSFPRYRPS